jgi:hypothetical protein
MQMRALYGESNKKPRLPEILNAEEMQYESGKSPINKVNFTQNYQKL